MPPTVSVVVIVEQEDPPGQLILLRADLPDVDRKHVWCGRSMGWRPLESTSNAFFHLFASKQEAMEAADQYVTLPVQD